MEIRQIFSIIQRWIGFVLLGAVVGSGLAYALSIRQPKAYQSNTRVQVMSAPISSNNVYAYFNDQQLAKTYAQTFTTRPILDLVEKRLGIPVSNGIIKIKAVSETQLIDIRVEYPDPQLAADIANTLVSVFAEKNNELQASRFMESEQSLQGQINQVDAQIQALQSQSFEKSNEENKEILSKAKTEIARLEGEILALKGDIYALSNPPGGNYWVTPTISPEDKSLINEKQLRLDQFQAMYDLYQQVYTNLIVIGSPSVKSGESNSAGNLQSTLALYEQIRSNLLGSYEEVRLSRLNSTSNIVQIEPALANNNPIRPQTPRDVGMGAVIGASLIAIIAFLVEYLDDTVKTAEQITGKFKLPVLGYISEIASKKDGPYVSQNPRSPVAEAFRSLRTNVEFSGVDKPIKSLLIVSANPNEGKSTVASNLAISMAQGGKRVLLIDADLRRPRIHHFFGLANRAGLSNLFRDSTSLSDIIQLSENPNLAIITSGAIPPNPADLLKSKRMGEVLDFCKETADITIVDAPPFLVADASILASRMDAVLLVVRSGKSPMGSLELMVEQMNRVKARIIGVVMNRIPRNHSYYYGGYRFYSSRYQGKYYDTLDGETESVPHKRTPFLKRLFGKKKYSADAVKSTDE